MFNSTDDFPELGTKKSHYRFLSLMITFVQNLDLKLKFIAEPLTTRKIWRLIMNDCLTFAINYSLFFRGLKLVHLFDFSEVLFLLKILLFFRKYKNNPPERSFFFQQTLKLETLLSKNSLRMSLLSKPMTSKSLWSKKTRVLLRRSTSAGNASFQKSKLSQLNSPPNVISNGTQVCWSLTPIYTINERK